MRLGSSSKPHRTVTIDRTGEASSATWQRGDDCGDSEQTRRDRQFPACSGRDSDTGRQQLPATSQALEQMGVRLSCDHLKVSYKALLQDVPARVVKMSNAVLDRSYG